MKYFQYLFVAFLMLATVTRAQTPVASFTASATGGCAPANIQFTNSSTNAVSYLWAFGNGNSSTLQHPGNVYSVAGNYTVTLTATSASGQTATSSIQIVVTAPPVAAFSAPVTVACRDYGLIQFQNTSTGFDSCVWDFGDGTTSNVFNPSHTYAVDGTFTVKLIVFNKLLGCSGILVRSSYITIHPRPSAVITVDTAEVCDVQHQFNFTANVSGNATSWLWDFKDGTTSAFNGNVAHTYSVTGNYPVKLYLENSFGCRDTAELTDTVKVKPNLIPVLTRSDSAGCEPLIVYYGCNVMSGATYFWDMGNGFTSPLRNPGLTYQTAGSYNTTFTINYTNGCSRTVHMTPTIVHPSPQVSYTKTNGSGCVPLTVTFTNTTPGVNTYVWNFGDGNSATTTNAVHTFTVPGQYVPTLTATNSSGCVRTYRSNWSPVNASGPIPDFKPDVTSGCSPLTVNFTNLTSGSNTYLWDFGDGDTSTQRHPTHIYTANGAYTVSLIAVNSMGCTDTFIYPVQMNVSTLSVSTVPQAPIMVCAPYTVYFSDNTSASAWLWDFGDGTYSNQNNPLHTYSSPGTYEVDLTVWLSNGGCSYTIPTIQTIIVSGTQPGFTYSVSHCPPYAVTFTDTSTGGAATHWTFGDGSSSSLQNPVHVYPGTGSYTVSLTATSPTGCASTLTATGGVSIIGLNANPSMVTTDTVAPFHVNFYSNSTQATSWLWNFGDGTTSTLPNPTHIYATSGPFSISLSIANDSCSTTYTNPPVSIGNASGGGGGFGNPVNPVYQKVVHCAPYSVNFYSPVSDPVTLLWDFGDGFTSSLLNPVHVYSDSGAFIPSLIYTDVSGMTDTIVYTDTFFVAKAPSDFTIATINTCTGIQVDVANSGPGFVNTWEFGGGVIQSGPVAQHLYPNVSGNYVIRLSSENAYGCKSTIAKSFSINVNSPVSVDKRRGCAGDTLNFLAGNINFSQYSWDFGDGTLSNLKNPVHVYTNSGIYQVVLTATDLNGCTMSFQLTNTIEIFNPVANFTVGPLTGSCDWVLSRVYDASTGATSILWDFGDGATGTDSMMFHYYGQPGYHSIKLTAYNNVCKSTMILPNVLYVADLIPGFTYVSTGNCMPSTVQFTDTSNDAISWFWDFGDGDTSTLQNPTHIYTHAPLSPVTLTVRDTNGCVLSVIDTIMNPTAADFTVSAAAGCQPLIVTFNDTSINAVSWLWDFGDGTFSTQVSPTHVFPIDGIYPVTLSVTGPDGCISEKTLQPGITVMTPVAAFNADSLSGCAPLMVNFANESSGATTYKWDFGDGDVSGLENPQHIYAYPGIYTVTLIASNDYGCSDTLVLYDYIVTRGSIPDFTLTPLSGCAPLTIQFTDASTGAVSWQWYFGDGTNVSGQNVSHTYADSGSFTPSLYTLDSTGCTSVFTYPQPIVVKSMPSAVATDHSYSGCSPVTVTYDATGSHADSLVWDMGDGTLLHGMQVNYTYSVPGMYQVQLIAFNTEGCTDTVSFTPVGVYSRPQVAFTVSDSVGCYPLAVNFINTSTNLDHSTFQWNFGNGVVDSISDPSYTYPSQGIYDVTLVVTNAGGCSDSLLIPGLITVYDHQPPVSVNWQGVTVNNATEVQLDFDRNTEPDVEYYVIYRKNSSSGIYDSIAVIQQPQLVTNSALHWQDQSATPALAPCSYKVVAVDICGYRLPIDSVNPQTTVYLTTVAGFMQVNLTWTPYGGKMPGLYGIYRSVQGMPFNRIAVVSSSASSYLDTTSYCPDTYTYKVIAEALDNTAYNSYSNTSLATPVSDIGNQEVALLRTTVVDNSYTLTEWKEPVTYPWLVSRYQIFRSTDNVQFNLIADVPPVVHEYEDHTANVSNREYYYKVTAVTECGSSGYSGPGSSIWLQARESALHHLLQWTPYKEWNTGVDNYRIEKLNQNGLWEEFRTVNGTVTEVEEE